ncbi:MAG TPA: glycoside hydrolase family 3 N-terminal domain-containing protein, partial [Propionibacteriaceae bacterium]|nr:glycoside hydrolase family 3 N-terminal domain-containing protein [Propionibacteriaceae bacterium]
VAQVRGFQGNELGAAERIIAGPKHFAGYGAALGGRDYDEVNTSDYELWNVYFPPFEAAVAAGAGNVMTAYMDLNGVPATGSPWLFTEILRDTWGFDGFVVSDANAVRNLHTHGFAADLTDAGARAINAGHGDGNGRPRVRASARSIGVRSGESEGRRRERPSRTRSESSDGPLRRAVRGRGPGAGGAR